MTNEKDSPNDKKTKFFYVRCTHDIWYRTSRAALDMGVDKCIVIELALKEYLKKLEQK